MKVWYVHEIIFLCGIEIWEYDSLRGGEFVPLRHEIVIFFDLSDFWHFTFWHGSPVLGLMEFLWGRKRGKKNKNEMS
jgi:hypothetical protein